MTGLIPLCAVAIGGPRSAQGLAEFRARVIDFLDARPEYRAAVQPPSDDNPVTMLAVVGEQRLRRVLERLADEGEFLSPHGIRSVSAAYRDRPFAFSDAGQGTTTIDYEPAESTTPLFGGNSNWRGPVWFPVNYLVIGALQRFSRRLGDDFKVEFPRGSGRLLTLHEIVLDLAARLAGIFLEGSDGRRPVFAGNERYRWDDALLFHEYFHGDNGAGLGASHQTGWTGLVADLIIRMTKERAAT
jgi:hypothetical protein